MSRKKPDAAAELAEKMLQVLESQRSFGGDAYPPTLQHLGELCDGAPSHDLILKAATKKGLTARASVEKVHGKPTLESKVYFKGDEPAPEVVLAEKLVRVLESQRRLGDGAYPPTLRRLAELSGFKGAEKAIRKAAETAPMAVRATVVARKGKALVVDAPVVLNDDVEGTLTPVLPCLLKFALSPATTKTKKGASVTAAFGPAELAKRVVPELRRPLESAVRDQARNLSLPRGIGWVEFKGEPLLFLTEHLKTADPPAPASIDGPVSSPPRPEPTVAAPSDQFRPLDFDEAFPAAFEILDRRNGYTNFVKLADLRQALVDFGREEFDAGLRQLRIDGVFSLDSHEGLHGSLSPEEREAGVREAGSLLVYASRR